MNTLTQQIVPLIAIPVSEYEWLIQENQMLKQQLNEAYAQNIILYNQTNARTIEELKKRIVC